MKATLAELKAIAARANLPMDWVVAQMEANATKEAATEAAWSALSSTSPHRPLAHLPGGPQIVAATAAIVAAIAVKGGVRKAETIAAAAPMAGLSLRDMAAEFQEMRTGVRAPRMGAEALFREVFASSTAGMQTTSDFGQLLGQAAQLIVIDSALAVSNEWRKIARTFAFNDFRVRDVAGSYDVPDLEEVPEHGEVTYGQISRALGKLGLKTFAKAFGFSRQAIINNDLSQFVADSATFGAMSGRSLSKRVWSAFGSDRIFTMSDGKAWLHADHNNVAASGSAITETSLAVAETALASQAAVQGKPLGLGARYLIVGINRRREALKLLSSEQVSGSTNTFKGSYELIYEPTFPVNGWALMADPAVHPVLAVSLLNGEEAPQVVTKASFDTFGLQTRVSLDYEAAPIDWTGVYFNPGPA